MRLVIALLIGISATSLSLADPFCIGAIEVLTGPMARPSAFETPALRTYLDPMLNAARLKTEASVLVLDYGGSGPRFIEAALSVAIRCDVIMGERAGMGLINAREMLGPFGQRNPFPNIQGEFKQMHLREKGKVAFITVGWIPKNYPGLKVRTEDSVTVITMTEGDPGWPAYALGFVSSPRMANTVAVNAMMDWVASPEGSERMGNWFYVVPDNTKLKRRVRIDLQSADGRVIASTKCELNDCFPSVTSGASVIRGKDGQDRPVCGKSGACPQFKPRPDFEIRPDMKVGIGTTRPNNFKFPSQFKSGLK